ncbi:BadF/BadG/BcrA/BcrD ATPase family protein [Salinibacterium sp. G-O1]|uniref:N-acetylglucosamine kinase n=1 Tax=Salinibacterium sp. G-O1 TaxID=3046208 RepID=UPI0024BB222B|nr:BadF/BadG/BcrA/BcrD ATPase family protein [Salinibacterium sp. G-O1]MDJ0335255.1 BadF/BadG/BcrA/BcrD ATPase family protein [Salinibacterium sp. G-O1]
MKVDIGVDGGQSQVRLSVVGRAEMAVSDGVAHTDGDPVRLLVASVTEAWARLRQPDDAVGRIVLGITTMPADEPTLNKLARALFAETGAKEVWLVGDEITAHLAALPEHHGVVLAVGTGVACLAVDARSGRVRRVDGDGILLGDNGGSFWIGRRGLAAALASGDGRGGETTLAVAAQERFGPIHQLAARVHARERPVNDIAQFASVVQDHARAGDHVATTIVREPARELVATTLAAASVCEPEPVPAVLLGRAASPGTPLRIEIERRVREEARLVLVAAAGAPLDGALELASRGAPAVYEQFISKWSSP